MKAAFCGSFDPVTLGHVNLIERSAAVFERVAVFISRNSQKNSFCTDEQKLAWLQEACAHLDNVDVRIQNGLSVTAARAYGAGVMIRGIRDGSEVPYEANMAYLNQEIDPSIETLALFCKPEYAYISSSNVREFLKYNLSIEDFVPECVFRDLQPALYKASRQK